MSATLDQFLSNLRHTSVQVSAGNGYPEPGQASLGLLFANGTKLRAEYWRLINDGKAGRSSFDHQQRYGLPAPIDAIRELQEHIQGKLVTDAQLDRETGDLVFQFGGNIKLQVFNFTGYEVWEINFPNSSVEYSYHVK
ncbi:MAG TPA: hypothetical protein VIX42_04975 [Edaphobacter sp.]